MSQATLGSGFLRRRRAGAANGVGEETAILRTAGVGVTFGGVRPVGEVSLSIKRGAITGLIGPNGAGKSTLLNVIAGVVRPTTGQISTRDTSCGGLLPTQWRA